jgi:diguanylate cyclase (GGDEF)-like protein/PAS domain S-box-containing protein
LNTQWTLFASILFVNTAAALAIAFLLARRPHAPGRRSLIAMLVMLALWNFAYAMITLSPSLEVKRLWLRIENIGILSVPVFWFFFAVRYNRLDRWLNRYTAALFFGIPILALVLLFSEQWFDLYYASVRPISEVGGPLVIERGPWYIVALAYAYLLNLATIALLVRRAIQYRNIYRRQMVVLIGAVLIPILVNVFYQVTLSEVSESSHRIDLTPISFTVSALLIAIGVFGLRIFDLIPIARHTVLEHIPEMVFVVDAQDRVVDANQVACRMLGRSIDEIVGRDPIEVFREWPQLLNRFLTASETREEIQIPGDPPRTLELVVAPLYNQANQLGGRVILAHDITERKWLENDLQHANQTLTLQLDEINKLRADLQEQAIRDPLTNVYNRRFLADFLDREVARAERERLPLSVVIMDVDNFKQFNDTHGHKCGDVVLQEIAQFLVDHTRRGDVVCRYGGEEFVILMPGTSQEVALERAEMWRQDFSETPVEYEGTKFFATFSAGVATFPQHGATDESLLQAADRALYRSKNAGRNKVTMYEAQSFIRHDGAQDAV